ncbi:hypothetical protein ACFL46_02700, partial [Candidatus Neomarinimicrobiota bacterium]
KFLSIKLSKYCLSVSPPIKGLSDQTDISPMALPDKYIADIIDHSMISLLFRYRLSPRVIEQKMIR